MRLGNTKQTPIFLFLIKTFFLLFSQPKKTNPLASFGSTKSDNPGANLIKLFSQLKKN
jgi:hypothetical protein